MVAIPAPGSDPRPSSRVPGQERTAWLVLAQDGPAADLPVHVAGTLVRVTADPRRFRDVLLAERPRIVVVSEPPAGDTDLDIVAAERRRRSGLRVLHLAPPDAVSRRIAALARGFDDALTTATTGPELAARLAWLAGRARERRATSGPLPVAEGVELDPVAHVVRRDGTTVHLRPKEYGLLAVLATHPNRAYTRRELLERVWGHEHQGSGRTVDVHVRWLRSKIEPDPDHPMHLVTVRGVGYRLDPPER